MKRLTDRVGPGTPAWNAYDRAIEAHRKYLYNKRNKRALKRYYNQRQYLVLLLKRHKQDHKSWLQALQCDIQRGYDNPEQYP